MSETFDTVRLNRGVKARVQVQDGGDLVELFAEPLAWQILLGALQQRDDFVALLSIYSIGLVRGIDYTGYLLKSADTVAFLKQVNELIAKHFPQRGL